MIKCDFCGLEFESVRRIAIDSGYDRLSVRHEKRYACAECSAKKQRERTKADSLKSSPDSSEAAK